MYEPEDLKRRGIMALGASLIVASIAGLLNEKYVEVIPLLLIGVALIVAAVVIWPR